MSTLVCVAYSVVVVVGLEVGMECVVLEVTVVGCFFF